jgi:hypothetical protein
MKPPVFSAVLLAAVTLAAATALPAPVRAGEAKKDDNKTSYIGIDTVTASVMALNGRHTVMTVQSGVDVPDLTLRARANQMTPRLRDAYAEELRAYAAGLPTGAPPDPDYVVRRLQAATDRILGKPGGRFLISGIMIN